MIIDLNKKIKNMEKMIAKANRAISKINDVVFTDMEEVSMPEIVKGDSVQTTVLQNQFARFENQFKLVHAR